MVSGANKDSRTNVRVSDVAANKFERLGPIMNAIGTEAATIVGGDPDGLYVYAEPQGGAVFASVFKDEGKVVRYLDPTDELFDVITEAWEAEDPDETKRWVVLEYEVQGTEFSAELGYPEDVDSKQHPSVRLEAALKRRYGDKPVIYPPMPDEMRGGDPDD
jgi:hypothetical protein